MKAKNLQDTVGMYGTKPFEQCKELNPSQVRSLKHILKGLIENLTNYCSNYYLEYGYIHANDNGDIVTSFLAYDEAGNDKVPVYYIIDTEKMTMTKSDRKPIIFKEVVGKVNGKNIVHEKDEEIIQLTCNFIGNLVQLIPTTVGMLGFPLTGNIKAGVMCPFKEDPNYMLIALDTDDMIDKDYF